jgi:hypothetical protein
MMTDPHGGTDGDDDLCRLHTHVLPPGHRPETSAMAD